MVATVPGGANTYVPSHGASGNLIVDFARDPNKFVVGEYTQIVKVDQQVGLWMKMNWDENGRVMDDDGLEYAWADGETAPGGRDGLNEFEYFDYRTKRRAYPFTLGQLAIDQASWDVVAQHAKTHAQKAMTVRTMNAIRVATTVANHLPGHVLDVTGGGVPNNTGTWAQSTTARQTIKRSINEAVEVILNETLAAYDIDQLKLVISDTLAKHISVSQELIDYLKGSPDALAQIKGELRASNPNAEYGLPATLYNVPLCVEKTRRVTSKRGAARAVSPVLATATPFITARPGSIEGHHGSPSTSAITNFAYEEMTTETKHDRDNRRTVGRIVEDFDHVMTSAEGIVLFQNAV